jgi:DNA-binding transcriptional ArsR family regulator
MLPTPSVPHPGMLVYAALGVVGTTASKLAPVLGLAVSTISAHLATLRRAKLVEDVWRGRRHVHRWRRGERLAIATVKPDINADDS